MLDLRRFTGHEMRLSEKLFEFNWGFLLLLTMIASIGFAMLYSVADGSVSPWALRQAGRFAAGAGIMIVTAMIDLRLWMRIAYPLYGVALAMLIAVEVIGLTGMGAQRWLDLGVIHAAGPWHRDPAHRIWRYSLFHGGFTLALFHPRGRRYPRGRSRCLEPAP